MINMKSVLMELKVSLFSKRQFSTGKWSCKYLYEVRHNGKLLVKRKMGSPDFKVAVVIKGHREPWAYSMPHMFKSLENFVKYASRLKVKPYGIAILQSETELNQSK